MKRFAPLGPDAAAATLDVIVRQITAVWWICDHEKRIVAMGGPALELTGQTSEDAIGQRIHERVQDAEVHARVDDAHTRAFRGETVRYTADFNGRVFDTIIAPFRTADAMYTIGTGVDVTVPRALERRMIEAQRAEGLGVLAGGLAHDFNNLLVAIIGNADLALRDIKPGSPGRAALENIRAAGLRSAELTNQLLAYAGQAGTSTQRVVVLPLVDELLRITPPVDNVHVEVAIPAGLTLRGDESQVRQVVMNLLGNARDALGLGGGTIHIRAENVVLDGTPHADDVFAPHAGTYVRLTVSDDGPGIPPEVRAKMFDPFFTTKRTGHGLGLAAVLGIVRAHGGGLRVRTSPGAAFDVFWPSTATPLEQPAVAPPRRTILVIDDEMLVRDVIGRMLEDLGYRALTAADGPSGLAIAAADPPDAVLVDLSMPLMSGADVVTALRARTPDLPIILCTGFDRDGRGPVAATAYLPKPFRMETLEQILAKVFP